MYKAALPSQERPRQQAAESEQSAQTPAGSITSAAPIPAATITCTLCDASFAPAPERDYAWQANTGELEAAFMSVCHFCFRCRRAACPECWDPVHRICAQCVTAAGLSFRAEPSPLASVIFPPVSLPWQAPDENAAAPFICIRHGRYQTAEAVAPDAETDHEQQRALPSSRPATTPVFPIVEDTSADQADAPALPAISVPASESEQASKPAKDEPARKPRKRASKVVETVLTVIALAVLLAVIILVVLAEASSPANAAIARLLHVDIRAEVAYLIALIKQIHW